MTGSSNPFVSGDSRILTHLAPRYDDIVSSIYRAGSDLEPWLVPLHQIAEVFDAWTVQLLGANKTTGVISFSFEAGTSPPEAALDYVCRYHRIDPRLAKVGPFPVREWLSCEDHFDDAFTEHNPFYRDYLIPYGARYLYGAKLFEDDSTVILIGHITKRGNPNLSSFEKAAFARLADHFAKALEIHRTKTAIAERGTLGLELLEKMRQPIILIDAQRQITYRNMVAGKLLARGDLVYDLDGMLTCRDTACDLDLTLALRALALVPMTIHDGPLPVPAERRSLRLRKRSGQVVAGTVLALRPELVMGSFGRMPQALFTVFEPGAAQEIDPFLLATTFDLTPAEARLAAKITNGVSPEECALALGVKISTIRSQLSSIFGKTGASGQADLVRLIISASAL